LKFQKHLKKKKKGTVEQVSKKISKAVQIPFIIAALFSFCARKIPNS
jgi:hypothetical protein